jgi:hypothetical protein
MYATQRTAEHSGGVRRGKGDGVRRIFSTLLASGLLLGVGCSSAARVVPAGSAADPCPIVMWWADRTNSLPEPADTPQSLSDAQSIADSLPTAEGQAFMNLYKDLSSNMSGAAYSKEATNFETSYC